MNAIFVSSSINPGAPAHADRSGSTVEVVRSLTPYEVDPSVGPMYRVRFADGLEADVFGDELTPWGESPHERLKYLRSQIEAESISYLELAELQSLATYIDEGDVLLLEWAGVPEFPEEVIYSVQVTIITDERTIAPSASEVAAAIHAALTETAENARGDSWSFLSIDPMEVSE